MEEYVRVRGDTVPPWRLYVKCLMALGMTNQSRSVLKRAVEYVKTDSAEIAGDYVSFERLYGSLE